MDTAPLAAESTETPASARCGCRPAGCPKRGAGQPSEAALRHRRNLAELGEIGMELARQIRQQTRDMGMLGHQGAKMFDQIARAVRRAHALEAKIEAGSRKTAEQPAAGQAAAPARGADPRERSDLRDDPYDDEDLFDDLDDVPDDEDPDEEDWRDEDGDDAVGGVMDGVRRTLARTRRQLKPANDPGAVSDTSAGRGHARPDPGSNKAAPIGPAAGVAGNGRRDAAASTAIPPALAWPPRAAAAHGPPQ